MSDFQVVLISLFILIIIPICTSFLTSKINESLGGQTGPYTKLMSLCYMSVAFVGLMILPFINNLTGFNTVLAIVVITAQAGVIPLQGLMINVLPVDIK